MRILKPGDLIIHSGLSGAAAHMAPAPAPLGIIIRKSYETYDPKYDRFDVFISGKVHLGLSYHEIKIANINV